MPNDIAVEDDTNADALQQQFYTAAMAAGTTGSQELDLLLQKGLYGAKMPKELKGKKAADAFQSAFDLIGGISRLALWADKNPTAFYSLYSKLIPSSVKADFNHKIVIEAPWMSADRLSYQNRPPADVIDMTPKDNG